MLDAINNIFQRPRERFRERIAMHDVMFRVLQNATVVKCPSANLQRVCSSPAAGVASDLPHFELYQCRPTGAYYVRQSGGLLGETVWYEQAPTTTVGSSSADQLH
jgi:hypothetical protein